VYPYGYDFHGRISDGAAKKKGLSAMVWTQAVLIEYVQEEKKKKKKKVFPLANGYPLSWFRERHPESPRNGGLKRWVEIFGNILFSLPTV